MIEHPNPNANPHGQNVQGSVHGKLPNFQEVLGTTTSGRSDALPPGHPAGAVKTKTLVLKVQAKSLLGRGCGCVSNFTMFPQFGRGVATGRTESPFRKEPVVPTPGSRVKLIRFERA